MSERPLLEPAKIHPDALTHMQGFHADIVGEVQQAVAASPVVVVGMSQNPVVKRARKALSEAGVEYKYLEYGSYFSEWKKRLAIKLWSGWPTFPQIYLKGQLVGGADQLDKVLADGSLKQRLAQA